MEAGVDYDVPEPQPAVGKCRIIIQAIDWDNNLCSGVCIQQDLAGATSGQPIAFVATPDMVAAAAYLDSVGNDLIAQGILPAGKVVIK